MFNSSENIITEILNLAESHKISLIDAAVHYAEKSSLEIEFLGEVLKKNDALKLQIELEAEELHFLKKKDRLPS